MRSLILIILMSVLHTVVAQDTLIQYFDLRWNRVQKQNASFYRKAFKNDKKTWTVIDYYIDGQLQMSGTYKSGKFKKKEGYFVYFFKNGQKSSEGEYNNDHNIGHWTRWHDTGELKMTRYVSILRGINVGGKRKILIADLKKLYVDLGFSNVTTYIHSGNVIFELAQQ